MINLTHFPLDLDKSFTYSDGKKDENGKIEYDGFKVNSQFGPRNLNGGSTSFHSGIDLYAPTGRIVYASHSGTVVAVEKNVSGYTESGYGNYVAIDDQSGTFSTLCGHLSSVNVDVGQQVVAGQIIGKSGNTGHSFGAHLHFSIWEVKFTSRRNSNLNSTGNDRDPLQYLINVGRAESGYSAADVLDYVEGWDLSEYKLAGEEKAYSQLFGRKYRILVYGHNGEVADISELKVYFDCTKTWTLNNSIGHVKIYNLTAVNESRIVMYAERVTIEAGYEGTYGIIYRGDVVQATRYKEGKCDFVTELLMCDGDRFLHGNYVFSSLSRGQTLRQAAESIVEGTGVTYTFSDELGDEGLQKKYIRGKCIFGTPYDALQVIAKSTGASTYIEDGIVNLTSVSDVPEGEILKLDYSSGLLGMPTQSQYTISFEALLNPKIKLNTLVQIDNQYIKEELIENTATLGSLSNPWVFETQGIYRIITINYVGDTRGDQWSVKCDAVSQSGSLPSILSNIMSNVN